MRNADRDFEPLHCAGSRHDNQLVATDLDAAHIDNRTFTLKLPADQFPGRENRQDTFNPRQRRERLVMQNPIVADHANDRPLLTGRELRLQSQLAKPIDNVVDFLFACFWF
ncbi:MAG: hypothetical protein JW395_3764 [Nitrospira sp.]|nr:hypothetical protein [Nitrospira sp.]